ncbi:hypothetical protein FRACYDRAFT_254420 [Fragilariopsis cylindrus CCMP1102]|uniref:Uncharacterized protein n=1 Tax=Fragilariopsis cylindrus CCMP1102 TaxID=635003 RepID=A0A1E7EKX2_9STRA|nr:hypothetical protein FRACYDRAFT_254420 [Fragilariopsis cylindrus CCMP1102]|eukprot:OEU06562.1 hypothetical protein FRACYDRAFT_254420 [Fragilariopsis cylindrus CCMP1102]
MSDDEEESILSLSTLLFAFVTLAVYILFLRPTPTVRNNINNNGTTATTATTPPTAATAARTTAVQQRRANALAGANANANARRQQQQQQNNNNNTTVATIQRRPPVLSENAIEILKDCKAYPPHVEPRSIKSNSNSNSIGCYNLLSDSGLVSFNYLKAASAATATANSNNTTKDAPINLTKKTATTNTNANANNNNSNNKLQRQERAKILSRLFANNSSTVATPPMKGSTFIIGVSYEQQLLQKEKKQKLAIIRVIKGLATYYNVLVIVAVDDNDNDDNTNSNNHHRYESTQKLHAQVVQTLRSSSSGDDEEGVGDGGEKKDDSLVLLSESMLPSHRILLSNTKSSAVGRIALVRQLSSNIGLTIDFNPEVKLQLEKFGYNVSIIKNWYETFPSAPSV